MVRRRTTGPTFARTVSTANTLERRVQSMSKTDHCREVETTPPTLRIVVNDLSPEGGVMEVSGRTRGRGTTLQRVPLT